MTSGLPGSNALPGRAHMATVAARDRTMRSFNTTGPVNPADHYCIPPLERLDLDDVPALVRTKNYFVLHVPGRRARLPPSWRCVIF